MGATTGTVLTYQPEVRDISAKEANRYARYSRNANYYKKKQEEAGKDIKARLKAGAYVSSAAKVTLALTPTKKAADWKGEFERMVRRIFPATWKVEVDMVEMSRETTERLEVKPRVW